MATTIEQEPLNYTGMPAGQQIIFTISNDTIVNNNFNVKFCAAVHVSPYAITLGNNNDLVGTFKTTPNGAGVGIFDLQPVLETFLKPDQEPRQHYYAKARYKGVWVGDKSFPLHLVDKYALSRDSCLHFAVNFYVEYSTTPLGTITSEINNPEPSNQYTMTNGALDYDDRINEWTGSVPHGYGYNMGKFNLGVTFPKGNTQSFLTNSPTTQYAVMGDYGTLPFLNVYPANTTNALGYIKFSYYDSAGGSLGYETTYNFTSNGGQPNLGGSAYTRLNYIGVFPGNLENWSANFAQAVGLGLAYYDIRPYDSTGTFPLSQSYRIKIICARKGYAPIRLTWLNKWGTWDYYTFNMKSTKSIKTKRIPYNQEGGTWNESTFKIRGYKGGKKNFRVNSTEKIKINTDFVTEEEGVWFEQLINSTEVYVLEGFQSDGTFPSYNTYVQPVTLTTSSYTRKTIANDRLMQYTFDIEKSKMKRTQAV